MYDPPRQPTPAPPGAPTEIDLVFNVRPCGTCGFFWPPNPEHQPYGPYPAYDFDSNTPAENAPPADGRIPFAWLTGTTRPPSFPDPEVLDGCRKAPIMTIGINPNLTAFALGRAGAPWCYPSFSSDDGTDAWTKYAYYYRYRSVYQESFDLKFAEQYLLPDERIVAAKAGVLVKVVRPSDTARTFTLTLQYDNDAQTTTIPVPGQIGMPRYVVLYDTFAPTNRFAAGAVLAARLDVPEGVSAQINGEPEAYYEQIVPTLAQFNAFLKSKGHATANVRPGEDVGQLDMVACASPHWGPTWLGGTPDMAAIIKNCVSTNAWALKQLVQTRPAVLFLIGVASYDMFLAAFGHLIVADPPLPVVPEDSDFTLLRATTDAAHPVTIAFSTTIDGREYALETRLVITPHFSYDTNYLPQFRLSPLAWAQFQTTYPDCTTFLQHDPRITFQPVASFSPFDAFMLNKEADTIIAHIKTTWPDAAAVLMQGFYDAHAMMNGVLEDCYAKGTLAFTDPVGDQPGYLTRADGPCTFCVNEYWQFPQGCPYGKPDEPRLPVGFLERVAAQIIAAGAALHEPARQVAAVRQLHDVTP